MIEKPMRNASPMKMLVALCVSALMACMIAAAAVPQAHAASLAETAQAAVAKLPANPKMADYARVGGVYKAVLKVMGQAASKVDELSANEASAIIQASNAVDEAIDAVNADKAKKVKAAKKAKVKKVKVKVAKKKATVSWKSLGKGYKYEVYYSLKKGKGYKKAGTVAKNKLVVKKLKSKKVYYVKVRSVRADIPEDDWESLGDSVEFETVVGKYSTIVKSKKIK